MEVQRIVNVSYNKNSLQVDNKTVSFPFNIYMVLVENDYIFVLLDIPTTKEYRNYAVNIYGLRQGEIIWRVEDPRISYPENNFTAFEGISFSDGKLIGTDFYGLRCIINKKTGKIEGQLPPSRW